MISFFMVKLLFVFSKNLPSDAKGTAGRVRIGYSVLMAVA